MCSWFNILIIYDLICESFVRSMRLLCRKLIKRLAFQKQICEYFGFF
jgi:hypothetical protein